MRFHRKVSHEELKRHCDSSSCWIALNGIVYDFTEFLTRHPGGSGVLLQNAGKDATSIFRQYHPADFVNQLTSDAAVALYDTPAFASVPQGETTVKEPVVVPSLSQMLNVYDFARVARNRISKEAWDYLVSAADDEVTYRLNERAFEHFVIKPRVLVDVSKRVDTSLSMLGTMSNSPIYISATAMGRLYHPDGEMALAHGAGLAGVIQMCPTLGSCSIEEMASARGSLQTQWFQLYVNQNWDVTLSAIRRAEQSGMKALCITVDVAIMGKRERDQRNRLVGDISHIQKIHDRDADKNRGVGRSLSSFVFPGLDWVYLGRIRACTELPILLKGIQTGADAILAYEAGLYQGIIVSNHGGRQVDYARPTLACLDEIVTSLKLAGANINKTFDVYVDGGIRRGTDIFKCLAMGAKAVGLGRPSLFALASHGPEGVRHLIDILTSELELVMMHTGCHRLSDIKRSMIEHTLAVVDRCQIHESRL